MPMNETQTAAVTPPKPDASVAGLDHVGRPPADAKSFLASLGPGATTRRPVKIDNDADRRRRRELLLEQLASFTRQGGFARRSSSGEKPPVTATFGSKSSGSAGLSASLGARNTVARHMTSVPKPQLSHTTVGTLRRGLSAEPASRVLVAEKGSAHRPPVASNRDATSASAKSIFPLGLPEQVTGAQLTRYARLIYEKTGIRVSPQKRTLLSNRLRRRLRETGIEDFDGYYRYLKHLRDNHPEWNEFFQEITTHETYLFRDENQWEWFAHEYLYQHVANVRTSRGSRSLRIWSAACSTGDEVYTIACCIAASLPNPPAWKIDILGTDIAIHELERAEHPEYNQRAMRLVPEEYLEYFHKDSEMESWVPKSVLRHMARFRPHNLMTRLKERPFDVVFLKNVLIYFDRASKKRALENVCPLVRPGGLLLVGAAEGVSSLIHGFRRLEPWLFQRLEG